MTHEYPPNRAFDSVSISRVSALREHVTQRQREFLVTVMVHSGCFLERQYCEFTGTVRGQNSREFMARLVARGFARVIEPGLVRRGRLYTTSTTNRSTKRSAKRTTATAVFARSAGWSNG